MISIKRMTSKEEVETAMELAWSVFQEYEAPDYDQNGIDEFYKAIHDETYLSMLQVFGAFDDGRLVGMIATRSEGTHIAQFFVDGRHHRRGIGRKLFWTVLKEIDADRMTVNAAPYATDIYHKLGFSDTDKEQNSNGIRYTPMERYAVRNMEELVAGLTEHDDKQAYRNLQALVNESNCGPDVYVYFHQFVQMMSNPKSYIRTRGITLIAANVKWDEDNRFDEIVAEYLRHVEDDKPITARQCIQTLPTLIRYKPYLKPEVEHALRGISYGKYKESMQSLIQRDVQKVLEKIKSPA